MSKKQRELREAIVESEKRSKLANEQTMDQQHSRPVIELRREINERRRERQSR